MRERLYKTAPSHTQWLGAARTQQHQRRRCSICAINFLASFTFFRGTSTVTNTSSDSNVRNFDPPVFFFAAKAKTPINNNRVAVTREDSASPSSKPTRVIDEYGTRVVRSFPFICTSTRSRCSVTVPSAPAKRVAVKIPTRLTFLAHAAPPQRDTANTNSIPQPARKRRPGTSFVTSYKTPPTPPPGQGGTTHPTPTSHPHPQTQAPACHHRGGAAPQPGHPHTGRTHHTTGQGITRDPGYHTGPPPHHHSTLRHALPHHSTLRSTHCTSAPHSRHNTALSTA